MGDAITEGTIGTLFCQPGDVLAQDTIVSQIETAKVEADVRIPEKGKIVKVFVEVGDNVDVGQDLIEYEVTDEEVSAPKEEKKTPAAPAQQKKEEAPSAPQKAAPAPTQPSQSTPAAPSQSQPLRESRSGEGEQRVKMTRMRKTIAQRLKESQNINAILTTFNEIDMSKVMKLRQDNKDYFQDKYGVKLGFMGVFCKAAATALQANPIVNAVIDGDDIVYRDYVDISIAVATPKGLVTPVIRNCESLSVGEIEQEIARLAKKAREGKIEMSDMQGGTFTISNGGVYGSWMGTPIVNLPQSAILGMHATKKRPIVITENGEDKIVIRPVMATALSYDHRIIDGANAVTTLKMIGDLVESPERLIF